MVGITLLNLHFANTSVIERSTSEKDSGGSFADVVGQRELKTALLAVAADDALDGLLIEGEKGTAKSTAVRALGDLLPTQRAVADCPYGCHPDDPALQCEECRTRADPPVEERSVPVVTLPLGATRDRVVGTLSVADAMAGDAEFDPGLLARAHRGILYVDEVNLLDDHLVDTLLDAAASGVNRVERDGVSVTHPAEFTLVGTMNPEEGDLRPQLRDRFALSTTVTGLEDIEDRVAVIDRALERSESAHRASGSSVARSATGRASGEAASNAGDEREPANRASGSDQRERHASSVRDRRESADEASGETASNALDVVEPTSPADRLATARDLLAEVTLPDEFAAEIAELCRDAGVDGHRGDIAAARASRALAALDGRTRVLESDVRRAAEFALAHRLRSTPFEDAPDPEDVVDDHFEDREGAESEQESGGGDDATDEGGDDPADESAESAGDEDGEADARPEDTGDGEEGDTGSGERPEPAGDGDGGPDDAGIEPLPEPSGADDGEQGEDDDRSEQDGTDEGDGDEEEATPLVPGAQRASVGESAAPDLAAPEVTGAETTGDGRASAAPDTDGTGPRVRTERAGTDDSIDATASVRAAATRGSDTVASQDLRQSVRADEAETLVLFVVDASASMRPAMRAAKGTVLELLRDAYETRDAVGFVAFAGEDSEVLLPPTDSVTLAARHLKELPTGDRTPLSAGLRTARTVLDRADPAASVVVLVTDGRGNVGDSPVAETRAAAERLAERDPSVVVVDAGEDGDRGALVDLVVETTDGRRVPLDALSAARVDAAASRN
ncbi:magnesium chelatase [Halobacteriales archaeon QH_7_66_36]|nr:MAG: magnesium chelatase [Halobacteriales archaeon QH_7_66_36]